MSEAFDPDWGMHPGEVLREKLAEDEWYHSDFARAIGYTEKHLSRVICGHVPMSAEFAVALEVVLTKPRAEFWLNMQALYDVGVVRRKVGYLVTNALRIDAEPHLVEQHLVVSACEQLRRDGYEPGEGATIRWEQRLDGDWNAAVLVPVVVRPPLLAPTKEERE